MFAFQGIFNKPDQGYAFFKISITLKTNTHMNMFDKYLVLASLFHIVNHTFFIIKFKKPLRDKYPSGFYI